MQEFGSSRRSVRDQLVREHADAARRIALRMARRCPGWIAREDLISAGMVGLIEAADRYDGSRQEPFISFAEHRIRGAVLDELRRGDIMPRRIRQLARKVSDTIKTLEKNGEVATDSRIAEALGVSIEHYRTTLAELVHVELAPLDDAERTLTSHDASPSDIASHRETLARVKVALQTLEPRDVTILSLYYIEDLTYQQIAETLRVTPSRVCQLLWRAVERVRTQLAVVVQGEAA
ncbi:MAG: sigma-70 family RNA polymerase sigma factor [Deltaproteobacteria bacterium]|nr:sigma-70 family RNA polymerase sigma factor [Deltaproteobacteria bacterium]